MNHVCYLSYFCGYDEDHALGILPLYFFGDLILKFFPGASIRFLWKNCANY